MSTSHNKAPVRKGWHLRTESGKHAACDMPAWVHADAVCTHTTREGARNEARRLNREGFNAYVVHGDCMRCLRFMDALAARQAKRAAERAASLKRWGARLDALPLNPTIAMALGMLKQIAADLRAHQRGKDFDATIGAYIKGAVTAKRIEMAAGKLQAQAVRIEKALQRADVLCSQALPKFNWAASALDADTIKMLNTIPEEIKEALK